MRDWRPVARNSDIFAAVVLSNGIAPYEEPMSAVRFF
jgi:hypothetical protein